MQNDWQYHIITLALRKTDKNNCLKQKQYALLAQLVEHLTLNQGVQGSSPWRRTLQFQYFRGYAFLLRHVLKYNEAWLSLVERCVRDAEVASSNLVASTKRKCRKLKGLRHFSFAWKRDFKREKPGFDEHLMNV